MSGMSEEQIGEIQEVFSLFDNKGDGKIAAIQLGDTLRALNQNPNESEIRKCGYSGNPDARISFEVFLPILQTISRNRDQHSSEDFIEGFRMFDKEQNGFISSAELRHILTCLAALKLDHMIHSPSQISIPTYNPDQHSSKDFIEGFRMFDKEQNGFISSAELRHILIVTCSGDKLTDDEVDMLLQGHEDSQGNINYEDFVKSVMNG